MRDDVAIIIPAYNPEQILKETIKKLQEFKYSKIVVIDDGSNPKEIFKEISKEIVILEHKVNKGKGRALKTGFKYCVKNFKNIIGVITVDADGQHEIEDINKIYRNFQNNKNSIHLGSRIFENKDIPLRSKVGNKIMSSFFEKKMNIKILDTQTGLRAIPIKYVKQLEEVEGERFEYETNSLIYCINQKIEINEVPIKTIYINKNNKSHFKVLRDSIMIYKSMKKYLKYNKL